MLKKLKKIKTGTIENNAQDIQQTFNNAANCDYFFHQTSRDLSL